MNEFDNTSDNAYAYTDQATLPTTNIIIQALKTAILHC